METIRIRPSTKLQSRPELFLLKVFPPSMPDGTPAPGDVAQIRPGLVVGREPVEPERFCVLDATMSRRHFRIGGDAGLLSVDDLGSANGTHVNGHRISSARLGQGDVIRAGSSLFLVCDREPRPVLRFASDGAVVVSAAFADAVTRLQSVASSSVPVLLLGQTGVGKDLFAELLHRWSGRPGEFCVVNCSAIPEALAESLLFGSVKGSYTGAVRSEPGWFRKADGGTLFLDELGDMPIGLQVKLNRALETSRVTPVGTTEVFPVDVRVVAATNRVSIKDGVDPGFRADLLARLEDEIVMIPPLVERREDIVPLIVMAAAREGREAGNLSVTFVEKALLYNWPRNVRQLLKVVAAALRRIPPDGVLDALDFDVRSDATTSDGLRFNPESQSIEAIHEERLKTAAQISEAIVKAGGNVSAAARELGINRRRMYRLMHTLGLSTRGLGESGEGPA